MQRPQLESRPGQRGCVAEQGERQRGAVFQATVRLELFPLGKWVAVGRLQ